jgi:hypothetical protein
MSGLSHLLHRAYDYRIEVWIVVVAALLLAWLRRNAQADEAKNYDAWWLHYARRRKLGWPTLRSPRKR